MSRTDLSAPTRSPHHHTGGTEGMDGIPPALLAAGSWFGSTVVLFIALAKGWLHVGSTVDKLTADKDNQITKLWAANESLTESVRKYAVSAETSAHALHEIEKRAAQGGDR